MYTRNYLKQEMLKVKNKKFSINGTLLYLDIILTDCELSTTHFEFISEYLGIPVKDIMSKYIKDYELSFVINNVNSENTKNVKELCKK